MTEELQRHLDGLRVLGELDQKNMLKAARDSYAEAVKTQGECEAIDAELVDELKVLKERMTNNRSRLADANHAIDHNVAVIAVLEGEKASRMIRKAAE